MPGSCGSSAGRGQEEGEDQREGKERSPRDGGAGVGEGWRGMRLHRERRERVLGRGLGEKVRGPGRVAWT